MIDDRRRASARRKSGCKVRTKNHRPIWGGGDFPINEQFFLVDVVVVFQSTLVNWVNGCAFEGGDFIVPRCTWGATWWWSRGGGWGVKVQIRSIRSIGDNWYLWGGEHFAELWMIGGKLIYEMMLMTWEIRGMLIWSFKTKHEDDVLDIGWEFESFHLILVGNAILNRSFEVLKKWNCRSYTHRIYCENVGEKITKKDYMTRGQITRRLQD